MLSLIAPIIAIKIERTAVIYAPRLYGLKPLLLNGLNSPKTLSWLWIPMRFEIALKLISIPLFTTKKPLN